jgi:hypothetical protein
VLEPEPGQDIGRSGQRDRIPAGGRTHGQHMMQAHALIASFQSRDVRKLLVSGSTNQVTPTHDPARTCTDGRWLWGGYAVAIHSNTDGLSGLVSGRTYPAPAPVWGLNGNVRVTG